MDVHSKEIRSFNMSRIRGKNTKPEELVAKYLFSQGFRYRRNVKKLPGTPDIVMKKYKTVIFINGCFWHAHEGCKYFVLPDNNKEFWKEKLFRNRERDFEKKVQLEKLGWKVITIWECQLKKDKIDETLENLKEKILEGTKKKFGASIQKKYLDRIKYELDIINKMGFCDYFLIVYDYVKYAKDNGILVGPGRGSAAGSLISYVLDITEVDPLKYDLLFERFLNIERVTMPDIDIDFEFDRREEVINYCKNKYGNDRVANIIAFGTLKSRAVIRDLGRVMDIDVNNLSKAINPNISLKDNYENVKKYLSTYELKKLYKLGLLLEGLKRNITMHAAGVVMGNNNLAYSVPMIYNGSDYISGYTPEYLEQIGLLKMDFLGLKNLSILRDSIEKVKKTDNSFDIYNIPLNDKMTLDLFKNGNTLGIFQFESSGMINFLKRLDVNSFDDIIVANALFRPGPANNIDLYINYKKGKLKPNYYDDRLKSILEPTYGVMIYQEQIMLISNVMAGYSLGEADILRRAMSKKKENVMEKSYDTFINGALKNGYSLEVAKKVFEDIKKFAQYGFNKSHSVAYALVSYQMAYLKANYHKEFMFYLLENNKDISKCEKMLSSLKSSGYKLLKPNINYSIDKYAEKNGYILLPLNIIRGLNDDIINKIIRVRENGFNDIFDFFVKTNSFFNKETYLNLIKSGALDIFKINKQTMIKNIDVILNYASIYSEGLGKPILIKYSYIFKKSSIPAWTLPSLASPIK